MYLLKKYPVHYIQRNIIIAIACRALTVVCCSIYEFLFIILVYLCCSHLCLPHCIIVNNKYIQWTDSVSGGQQRIYVTGHTKKGLMRLFQVLEIITCCYRAIQVLLIATCSVQIWCFVDKLSYVEELSF